MPTGLHKSGHAITGITGHGTARTQKGDTHLALFRSLGSRVGAGAVEVVLGNRLGGGRHRGTGRGSRRLGGFIRGGGAGTQEQGCSHHEGKDDTATSTGGGHRNS